MWNKGLKFFLNFFAPFHSKTFQPGEGNWKSFSSCELRSCAVKRLLGWSLFLCVHEKEEEIDTSPNTMQRSKHIPSFVASGIREFTNCIGIWKCSERDLKVCRPKSDRAINIFHPLSKFGRSLKGGLDVGLSNCLTQSCACSTYPLSTVAINASFISVNSSHIFWFHSHSLLVNGHGQMMVTETKLMPHFPDF